MFPKHANHKKLFPIVIFLIISKVAHTKTIKIEFTEDDTYSIEVAKINVGDTIEWLPKNKGHNVEFLAVPKMNLIPTKSEIDMFHSVVFKVSGVYLYGCAPHSNMRILGLIVVGNDFHNLEKVKNIQLSHLATSVLKRLIRIAQSHSKSS